MSFSREWENPELIDWEPEDAMARNDERQFFGGFGFGFGFCSPRRFGFGFCFPRRFGCFPRGACFPF